MDGERLLARLRANLTAVGIPLGDDDLAVMVERGYLENVADSERALARYAPDTLPDYLADHGYGERAAVEQGATLTTEDTRKRVPGHTGYTEKDEGGTAHSGKASHARAAGVLGHDTPVADAGVESRRPYPALPPPPAGLSTTEDQSWDTIADVAKAIQARRVSPVELTERSLRAIAAHDGTLNAFQVVTAEQALAEARRAEREIGQGAYRGPMHGVPLAVKDLLAMAGTITTAGSRILAGNATDYDASVVERLRAAGAIIVGKTRLSEFAYSPGSNNAHFGPTRNPWHLAHDTGGSSSGSAAAVAAGLVFGALGSDTGGSIRIPAAQCGLVGLKPTYGRVSLHGAVTLSWSLDHLGPLARTVEDAALLLAVLEGCDARDARGRAAPPVRAERHGVRGLRVGVLADDGSGGVEASPEALAAWRAGVRALADAGATLIEVALPEWAEARLVHGAILVLEALAFHQATLRDRPEEYGEFPRRRILRAYAYAPDAFVRAQQARTALRGRMDAVFERVDLLSTPTMPDGAPLLGVPASIAFTAPGNLLGWPALSVPVGRTSTGLPLGLQLMGRCWDEATVLDAGAAVEACGLWR